MASESNWSDRKKWIMGILSALIVTAIIALASRFPRLGTAPDPTPKPSPTSEPSPIPEPSLSPELSPTPELSPPPPPSPKEATSSPNEVIDNDYKFNLRSCKLSSSKVKCEFLVTNMINDRELTLGGANATVQAIDNSGNEYIADKLTLGSWSGSGWITSNLPNRVPVKAIIQFSVRPEATKFAVINLECTAVDGEFTAKFENVPLQ
jgi:hypothetical protein